MASPSFRYVSTAALFLLFPELLLCRLVVTNSPLLATRRRVTYGFAFHLSRIICYARRPCTQRLRSNIRPAIHVDGPAGDAASVWSSQIRTGEADVHDVDQLSQRRAFFGVGEESIEIFQAG